MISESSSRVIETHTKDNYCQAGDSFCQNAAPEGWEKTTFLSPLMIDFEREMKDSLIGNVMDNFEKTMMKETKKFDEMKREVDRKEALIEKDRNSRHIPSTLNNEGVNIDTLWHRVNNLIVEPHLGDDDTFRKANMKGLNPEVYQMLLSHGIGAWLSTLNRDHFTKVTQQIYSETSQWISKIWRFRCSASLFHNKLYDGILSVCKVALASQYPKYQTDGHNALYSRPPVIYLNGAVDPILVDVLKINLGLPSDSICRVPNNFELGGDESIDIVALEQLILADTSGGKMPLIICAYAGTPNTGCMDRLNDIHNLCRIHRIWLHMEGFRLSELALLHVPAKVNTISSKVKSITLDLGSWLGIPSVPFITLVMTKVSESYMNSLGFGNGYFIHNNTAMDIFPLWLSLQLIGHEGIVNKIENQTRQNHRIITKLKTIPSMKLVHRKNQLPKKAQTVDNKSTTIEGSGIRGLMDTVLTFLLDGHQVPFVIVFRYDPSILVNGTVADDRSRSYIGNGSTSLNTNETIIRKPRFVASNTEESQMYLNSLNQWLADNLIGNYPQMNITLIHLPSEGICLRLCLHEGNIGQDITEDVLDRFFSSVNQHVSVMNATINQRSLFHDTMRSKSQLLLIDVPSWAGLGCVLFIPEMYQMDLRSISSDEERNFNNQEFLHFLSAPRHLNEINKINKILIDELRNDDEAFSLGLYNFTIPHQLNESAEDEQASLVCVRFGLITEATMVEQLVELVVSKGEQVEASTKNLEKFSQLVKEGIDKVTEELAKEHEEKLKQDGVLRQVPYIDSIINWWYPPDRNQIKGRSLNLSSGEIQVTDDTYKYKMQLQAGPRSVFTFNKDNIDAGPDQH